MIRSDLGLENGKGWVRESWSVDGIVVRLMVTLR